MRRSHAPARAPAPITSRALPRGLPRAVSAAVTAFALLACGGGDGDPTGTEGPDEPGGTEIAGSVGPSGGTVSARGGALRLTFPAGAVSEEIEVTVGPLASPPPSPDLIPGSALDLGPDGASFGEEVEIVFRYDPSELPAGMQESSLGVYRARNGGWLEADEVWTDTAARTVTAKLRGFSGYGLLGNRVADVAGLWFVEVEDTETTCPPAESDAFEVRIEQSGKVLEISGTDPDVAGLTLPGRISGNAVSISGTVTVDGAEETLDVEGTFSADVTTMSGTSDWSVRESDGTVCSGRARWSATRR